MNSFTHTGFVQVLRRISDTELGSNYPEEEIVGTVDIADSIALWSALAIVNVSTDEPTAKEELGRRLLDRLKEFVGTG